MKTLIAALVALLIAQPRVASAQVPGPEVWRHFAERLEAGTRISVRMHDGRRVRATLVQVGPDALLIQPRTRLPVPVQPVPYAAIASIEREQPGMSAARAAAIGIGSGTAAFFGILLILLASLD